MIRGLKAACRSRSSQNSSPAMMGLFSKLKPRGADKPRPPPKHTNISDEAIDEMIDDFMKDKAINQTWIPDYIERTIYKNVLKLVVALMAQIIDGIEITVMGHKIVMDMRPNDENTEEPETGNVEAHPVENTSDT